MHLSDLSTSQFLASDDYIAGTVLPIVEIESIKMTDVPIPNSTKKASKAVIYFKGAGKGYVVNKGVARKIGAILGETKNIDRTWVGAKIQLEVVSGVRRPDGSTGLALRLHAAWKKDAAPADVPANG
jgi:hypothetical protein